VASRSRSLNAVGLRANATRQHSSFQRRGLTLTQSDTIG
jgi:hypothetical protein